MCQPQSKVVALSMSSLTWIAAPPTHRGLSGLLSCASLPSLLCLAPQLIGHKLRAGHGVWCATTDHAPSRQLVGIDRDPLDLDALGRRSPLGPLRLGQPLRIAVVHLIPIGDDLEQALPILGAIPAHADNAYTRGPCRVRHGWRPLPTIPALFSLACYSAHYVGIDRVLCLRLSPSRRLYRHVAPL